MSALQRFQIYCTLYGRQRYQHTKIHSIFVFLVWQFLTVSDIFRRPVTVDLSSTLQRTFNTFTKQGFYIKTKPINSSSSHVLKRERGVWKMLKLTSSALGMLGSHFSFHFSRTMRVIDICAIETHMNHKTAHQF